MDTCLKTLSLFAYGVVSNTGREAKSNNMEKGSLKIELIERQLTKESYMIYINGSFCFSCIDSRGITFISEKDAFTKEQTEEIQKKYNEIINKQN